MSENEHMRAADADRHQAAELLRGALDEGRLSLAEYDERIAEAYKAVTYADLNRLLADLPLTASGSTVAVPAPAAEFMPHVTAPRDVARIEPRGKRRRIPLAVQILWVILTSAFVVNLVVWAIVSATTGHLLYFWPIWVIGPAGAALLGVTVGIDWMRHQSERRWRK